jgi:hypothetical protein
MAYINRINININGKKLTFITISLIIKISKWVGKKYYFSSKMHINVNFFTLNSFYD